MRGIRLLRHKRCELVWLLMRDGGGEPQAQKSYSLSRPQVTGLAAPDEKNRFVEE